MVDRRTQLQFVRELVLMRAWFLHQGYIRRNPLALLHLAPGHRDPYPLYDQIRAAGPLADTLLHNFQSAHHAICNEVLRDRRFGVTPERPGGTGEPRLSFLEMNPPDHTRLRRLAAPAFSPRAISGFGDRIERVVADMLDQVPPGEPFDLITTLAAPMPIAVITDLLGIPHASADKFARYGATIGSALSGVRSLGQARRLWAAEQELAEIFAEVFELKRRKPGDDVISRLMAAEGETVRPAEIIPLCTLLLIAGFETTVNLIGNTVLALLDHPEQWRALTEEPSLAANAVEETLRYDPPVQRTARIASEDAEIAGRLVRRDQFVFVMIGGANRDPAVYPDPNTFDLNRKPGVEHLAFSSGIHYCLGAPLAKLEATIAVRAVAERFPRLVRSGRLRRRSGDIIRGLQNFPVREARRATPLARAA